MMFSCRARGNAGSQQMAWNVLHSGFFFCGMTVRREFGSY